MFNVNNAPVSHAELERFTQLVASSVDRFGSDPAEYDMAIAVDDRGDALLLPCSPQTRAAMTAKLDQLLATPRRMAAMVSLMGWSPDASPTVAAWVVVAVGRGSLPALVCVRRLEQDDRWTLLNISDMPWLILSSAAGLRAALSGQPLRLKVARTKALFQRPDQVPNPPVDERGAL
ncbi:hypothetical protein [Egicoccus halophilus]|uniref:Uncharacterized protein n=1 Tax=Egicoccus halophilus TaxID=1670830 RepID=A0A8J3EUK3_9ACTN|nr:hypothetical protein [Egicoccus halophilus]GGI07878.1 hypothetical protein GCM10011354_26280 [Egicoccus halophilus]